jgi:hypothetical protein
LCCCVLNLKGEVIAKSESKNFQGEYVGQLKLNKKDIGTFVVLVSQGEDGATKKSNNKLMRILISNFNAFNFLACLFWNQKKKILKSGKNFSYFFSS